VQRLSAAVGGRLAVVSGRALGDIDRILEDGVRPVAAVHGLVRRCADGRIEEIAPHPCLALAREALGELARTAPGLLLEDKILSVALHYRLAPEKAGEVQAMAARLAEETGLKRQDGAMVCELRTPGPSKGDSVRTFLAEPPFHGSAPVFLGDDVTDEDGFQAVAALGGYGVLVGPSRRTRAAFRLESVDEALAWLEGAL
jgi:trehalose 6-phosphate phosphatase